MLALPSRSPLLLTLAALVASASACGNGAEDHAGHSHGEPVETPLPTVADNARVFFVSPTDGATVVGPLVDGKVSVHVQMGVENLTVQPAGTLTDGAGHHHIIVDGDPVPRGTAVPADATHIHYGRGQTEADLQLEPGPHTLRLQFADGAHRSYGSALHTLIHVNVAPTTPAPAPAEAPTEAAPSAE